MADPRLVADLADLVRSVTSTPPDVAISADSRLHDDLGVDSFDLVGIVFAVQDRFRVRVDERDLPALGSLADLAAYVADRRAA